MWRPSATSKRTTSSPPASPKNASPTTPNTQPSFRRGPSPNSNSTLEQALKTNPFKIIADNNLVRGPRPVTPPELDPVVQLNDDLRIFASIYSDVKLEVLRELLLRFDGESRLHICTEQLVKYKSEWARGRLLNPPRDAEDTIPVDELFRTKAYIAACKYALDTEFKSLNKSAIDAVLAEVNQSYSKARPILQGIAAKSWRAAISSFFKKRKGLSEAPAFLTTKANLETSFRITGNVELDQELDQLFFAQYRSQQCTLQQRTDHELASTINQNEAEEAGALFECQVCYNDVPFETLVTCTTNAHIICRDCVRHTLNEAVFGQGWARSIDVEHGTLRCLASDSHDDCPGHVSSNLLEGMVLTAESGREMWNKFEQRLAIDNMIKSGLPLTQCPFCYYAESPRVHSLSTATSITWVWRKQQITVLSIFAILLAEILLPTLLVLMAVSAIFWPGLFSNLFYTSLINIHCRVQTQRFHCKNPACSRKSCLSCSKPWHDPHTCHEPLILSLRTAVEAARTAALKRTCPRCGTSFIKSSGCNKLTCVCGYAMCYLCRKNIGKTNSNGAVDDREGGEGYRHFCEHFRPTPGQKCTECNKCDLYMSEDEELSVKRAGEDAERAWREKEGMVGVKGLGLEEAVGNMGKLVDEDIWSDAWNAFISGNWTVQGVSDWAVDKLIKVED